MDVLAKKIHGGHLTVRTRFPLVDHTGVLDGIARPGDVTQDLAQVRVLLPLQHLAPLLAAADGHDVLIQLHHVRLQVWVGDEVDLFRQHLPFPRCIQDRDAVGLFVFAYFMGHRHAALEQTHQLLVDLVDALAQFLQFAHILLPHVQIPNSSQIANAAAASMTGTARWTIQGS